MGIDVKAELTIDRPAPEVAEYAMNPDYDAVWVTGITEAEKLTPPPLGKGTRVKRVASFMGKRIDYVVEVVGFEPTSLMDMKSVEGPFPMDVTYAFEDAGESTVASIRIRGETSGFYALAGPLMSRAVKRNITNDLHTLKDLMESGADK